MRLARFLIAIAMTISSSVIAQTPLVIKKHAVGETTTTFLANDSEMAEQLESCRQLKSAPRQFLAVHLTPSLLEGMTKVEGNNVSSLDQRLNASKDQMFLGQVKEFNDLFYCDETLTVFDQHGTSDLHREALKYSGTHTVSVSDKTVFPQWSFENGILMEFRIEFLEATYGDVLGDLTARVGKPGKETDMEKENGYGATWTEKRMEWLTGGYDVVLISNPAPTEPLVALIIKTRDRYEREAKVKATAKSPLE